MGKRNHSVENWIESLIIIVKAKVIFEGKFNIRKSSWTPSNHKWGIFVNETFSNILTHSGHGIFFLPPEKIEKCE